jgi:hypothetical protein
MSFGDLSDVTIGGIELSSAGVPSSNEVRLLTEDRPRLHPGANTSARPKPACVAPERTARTANKEPRYVDQPGVAVEPKRGHR